MEGKDWARVLLHRWWIVVLVPLLAAGVAAGLFLTQPVLYRGKATVVVPLSEGAFPSFNVVNQSVSNFRGALISDAVADRTSAQTGLPTDDIRGGISSRQLGTSNVVEVVYTSETRSEAADVAEGQARNALTFILEATSAPASVQIETAQQAYDAAEQAVEGFLEATGLVIPSDVFREETDRLIRLRDRLNLAGGEDPQLQARILRRQQQVTELVTTWDALQVRRQRALNSLFAADSRYLAAQAQIEAARQPEAVVRTEPRRVAFAPRLLRRVTAAGAVGLALAVGLVALLEASAPRITARR